MEIIYDNPEYWCGEIGYRPPGYSDFPINLVKEVCVILHNPASILDIGCAFGYSVNRLRKLGYSAWGLDISKYAISQAPIELKPYLIHSPAWDIPIVSGTFDFIFSSGVLEHLTREELDKAIKEIKRVGSRGLIGVSCKDDTTTHEGDDDTHEVILTRDKWQELFSPEFKIISDSSVSWFNYLGNLICRRIE